jgi:glycosyltransferase involved in cell wall biosynthesis
LKRIVLFTNSFPFGKGEEFLETEILYWEEYVTNKKCTLTIIPQNFMGEKRVLPKNISVDISFAQIFIKNKFFLLKSIYKIKAFFSITVWREIIHLFHCKKISISTANRAIKCFAKASFLSNFLSVYFRDKYIDASYHYWCDISYLAAVLKDTKKNIRILCRAHGIDLYEDQNKYGYIPLRKQFIDNMKEVRCISNHGISYLTSSFNIDTENLYCNYLGVHLPKNLTSTSPPESIHIVSVSSCTEVKRVDKIIESLIILKKFSPKLILSWTHFGDGPLSHVYQLKARKNLISLGVRYKFAGHCPNHEILKFYDKNSVDLFLNTSEGEGIPVSIMEAMSYGIPVIAPDVGGIAEIVDDETGILLVANFEPIDCANAITLIIPKLKSTPFRESTRRKVSTLFNAKHNYPEFIKTIIQ